MPPDQLRLFDGHDVEAFTYRVTGSVDVDLAGMSYGEKVFLLVEARCAEVRFKPLSKDDPDLLAREHVLAVDRCKVFGDRFEAERILEGLANATPPGDDR